MEFAGLRNVLVSVGWLLFVVSASSAGSRAPSDDPPAAPSNREAERLARVDALRKEYGDALLAHSREVRAALAGITDPTPAQRREAAENAEAEAPDPAAFAIRGQAIVQEDRKDAAALHAYVFLDSVTTEGPARAALREAIVADHLDREELGDLGRTFAAIDRRLAERIAAESPHAAVRGKTWHAIGEAIRSEIPFSRTVKSLRSDRLDAMRAEPGGERVDALLALEPDAANGEIVRIARLVAEDYPSIVIDAGTPRERTLGDWAAAQIRRLVDLAIGRTAPEIEGVDLDGAPFRLSDYRGKVVLLDFWGFW